MSGLLTAHSINLRTIVGTFSRGQGQRSGKKQQDLPSLTSIFRRLAGFARTRNAVVPARFSSSLYGWTRRGQLTFASSTTAATAPFQGQKTGSLRQRLLPVV